MLAPPLQLVDSFLLQYNVGQALLFVFILATLGALPLRSQKVMAFQWTGFGLIFLLTPASMEPVHYKFLGIGLLFLGPMLWITAKE